MAEPSSSQQQRRRFQFIQRSFMKVSSSSTDTVDEVQQRLLPDPVPTSSSTVLDDQLQYHHQQQMKKKKKNSKPLTNLFDKSKPEQQPSNINSSKNSNQGQKYRGSTSKRRSNRVSFSEEKKEDSNNENIPRLPKRNVSAPPAVSTRPGKENTRRGSRTNRRGTKVMKDQSPPPPPPPPLPQQPKQGGLLSGLGKRLSGRFSGDHNNKRAGFVKVPSENNNSDNDDNNNNKPLPIDAQEEELEESDPVMTIFESRNTQRVRFSLEGRNPDGRTNTKDSMARATSPSKDEGQERKAAINIKQFMARALFGGSSNKSSKNLSEELQREVAKELGDKATGSGSAPGGGLGSLVWESAATPTGPEVIHTNNAGGEADIMLSFTEDSKARAQVVRLLNKARRAEHIHFRYEYAVKCYVKALNILTNAKYPDDHPTVQKTMRLLNNSHHVLSSYNNSANIVKMGIKYEDAGELVRALKMYTIAYRIRRDNLSQNHPSLAVLLNMLGSIQIKRGELKEAMQIYELALKDSPVIFNADDDEDMSPKKTGNLLAKSVTYREMGTIYERWGKVEEALNMYHKSLECVSEWKEAMNSDNEDTGGNSNTNDNNEELNNGASSVACKLENVHLTRSADSQGAEQGEMELFIQAEESSNSLPSVGGGKSNTYESFFPIHLEAELDQQKDGNIQSSRDMYADMDLALTLHQIGQLHRCQGQYENALDAFEVALRGMKYALGRHHPNVAAVLGNIGNLQKEMGGMDAAYSTYQEVLGIESYRLGLSHPDVAITLHNIATIDAARGNFHQALTLYQKVLGLQKKLFGADHLSVSVTAACMGDVYERVGELKKAMDSFEEAVRIKSAALGRHSLEVSRLLHKLGKLAAKMSDYHMAGSFISRAVLIYRLNKLTDDNEWIIDAYRDTADIDAKIAMGSGRQFEC